MAKKYFAAVSAKLDNPWPGTHFDFNSWAEKISWMAIVVASFALAKPNQTKPTKPKIPNQTYPTKLSKIIAKKVTKSIKSFAKKH